MGKDISLGTRASQVGETHISRDTCFLGGGSHITRDMRSYSLERRFFLLEYPKGHFPGLKCLKKKVGKMAIFGPKPWVNPFRKMSLFRHFELFFYSLKRRYFVLEYRKRHFPGVCCLKKKVEKIPIFGPKPWVNPFGKLAIFPFLNFFFGGERKAFFRSRLS